MPWKLFFNQVSNLFASESKKPDFEIPQDINPKSLEIVFISCVLYDLLFNTMQIGYFDQTNTQYLSAYKLFQ